MSRMHVIDYPKKWEYYLHLVEFAYNNHYQASTKLIVPLKYYMVGNVIFPLHGVI